MAKKKRYYQSAKDRLAESRGMERMLRRRDKFLNSYEGDGLIKEDINAPANLPQQAVHKYYPRVPYGASDNELIDTLPGIDYQISQDSKRQKKGKYPSKY